MSFWGAFCLSKAKCLFDSIMGCKWKSDNYRIELLKGNSYRQFSLQPHKIS